MKKKAKSKEKNKKKFLRFSEIMQRMDVDTLHSVKEVDLKPHSTSFALDTLNKWNEINITQDMIQFKNDVFPLIQTLPEIVHHKKKIVNKILSHLEAGSNWIFKPVLEFLTSLVRDLQSEIYDQFPRIFDTLVNMLDVKHAKKTEAIFLALSHLFHYLRKHMSTEDELLKWFQRHQTFLGHRKWFVRRFAAQSFAFLIRRLSSERLHSYLRKSLLEIKEDNATPWLLDGIGILFFETVRGISGRFHSKCSHILSILFQNLDWDEKSSWNQEQQSKALFYRYLALFKALRLMCKHGDAEHSTPIWEVLQNEISRLISNLQKKKIKKHSSEAISRQIGWICSFASYWVQHNNFKNLTSPLKIAQTVMNRDVFHSKRLDKNAKLRSLLLVYMLYLSSGARYEGDIEEMLEVIFEYDQPELVSQLFGNIKHRAQHLFPFLLKYCERHIEKNPKLVLSLLLNTIQTTYPNQRASLPLKTGILPFTLQMVKEQTTALGKLEQSLKTDNNASIQDIKGFDPVLLWTGFDVLCKVNLKSIVKKTVDYSMKTVQCLHSILLSSSSSLDFNQMYSLFNVCLECFTRSCTDYKKQDQFFQIFDQVKDVLKKHIHSNAVLEAAEYYFTRIRIHSPEESENYFTISLHQELLELSITNLSSPISSLRATTLSILCEFPQLDLLSKEENHKSKISGRCKILELGNKIEQMEHTLENAKTVIMYLDKIGALLSTGRVPGLYAEAAVHQAIGMLYVKMKLIGNSAQEVLVTASSSYKDIFWKIFSSVLDQNFESVMKISYEDEDDNTMVYESNKKYDIVDLETDPSEEMLESKMKPLPTLSEMMKQPLELNESYTDALSMHQYLWGIIQKSAGLTKNRISSIASQFKRFLKERCHFDIEASQLEDNRERDLVLVDDYLNVGIFKSMFITWAESKIKFKYAFPGLQKDQFQRFCTFYLSHRFPEFQMLSLKCLFRFNFEWITPYKNNLERLIDKKKHREEIIKFPLAKDSSPIAEEHRPYLIPIILRIIFVKFGKYSFERKDHVARLISYIANVEEGEVNFLVDHVMKHISNEEESISEQYIAQLDAKTVEHFLILFQETVTKMRSKLKMQITPMLDGVISILKVFGKEIEIQPMEDSQEQESESYDSNVDIDHIDSEKENESDDNEEDETDDDNDDDEEESDEDYEVSDSDDDDEQEDEDNDDDDNEKDLEMIQRDSKNYQGKQYLGNLDEPSVPQRLYEGAGDSLIVFFSSFPEYEFTFKEISEMQTAFEPCITLLDQYPTSYKLFKLLELWISHESLLRMLFPFAEALHQVFHSIGSCEANETRRLLQFLEQLISMKHVPIELSKPLLDNSPKSVIKLNDNNRFSLWSSFLKQNGNVILEELANICKIILGKAQKIPVIVEQILAIMQELYESISDPSLAEKLMSVFLPAMKKMSSKQNNDLDTIMNTVLDLLPHYQNRSRMIPVIADMHLKITIQGYREKLNKMLSQIMKEDQSLITLLQTVQDLNAFSNQELGGYDFEKRIAAFQSIAEGNIDDKIQDPSHAKILVMNMLFYLQDDEVPIKQGASAGLKRLILLLHDKCQQESENQRKYNGIMNLILRNISTGIQQYDVTKNEYIMLIGYTGEIFNDDPNFKDIQELKEMEFFENVTHFKNTRVVKALKTYKNLCNQDKISEEHAAKHFIPILMKLLASAPKGSNVLKDTIFTLVAQTQRLSWPSYYSILDSLLRSLSFKSDRQSVFVETVAEMLSKFPFKLFEDEEDDDFNEKKKEIKSKSKMKNKKFKVKNTVINSDYHDMEQEDEEDSRDPEIIEIEEILVNQVIPRLKNALFKQPNEKEKRTIQEKGKERMALIIIHILNVLPKKIREDQLPLYIQELANKLKSKEDMVRSFSRSTLSKIANVLGPYYLYFILQTLKDTLVEGRMLHVLGYTVHTILHNMKFKPGDIDHCLPLIQEILENELFGTLKEQKTGKSKITEKKPNSKAYLVYEIIGTSFSLSKISELIESLEKRLQETSSQVTINTIRYLLNMITQGMQKNKSITDKDILAFVYHSIHEKLDQMKQFQQEIDKKRQDDSESRFFVKKRYINRLAENYEIEPSPGRVGALDVDNKTAMRRLAINKYSNTHNLIIFYMELLHESLKKRKITDKNLLDPCVPKLINWMSSKYDEVSVISMKIISEYLLKLNLESIFHSYFEIVEKCLSLLNNTMGTSNPIAEACFSLMSKLLRIRGTEPSTKQIQTLMRFVKSDVLDIKSENRESSLKTFKAIVDRKIIVPEVYDLINIVRESLLTSIPEIQRISREILVKFFLDYPLNQENIRQHIRFLLKNIDFDYPQGRLSLIGMIKSLISRSPVAFISEQFELFFLPVVVQLCNEPESDCRQALSDLTKSIITNINAECIKKLMIFLIKWFSNPKSGMRRAAAQVTSITIDAYKSQFKRFLDQFLPILQLNLTSHSDRMLVETRNEGEDSGASHEEPVLHQEKGTSEDVKMRFSKEEWDVTYFTLICVEKLLKYQIITVDRIDTLEQEFLPSIIELLMHQHPWIRTVTDRIMKNVLRSFYKNQRPMRIFLQHNMDPIIKNTVLQLHSRYLTNDLTSLIQHNALLLINEAKSQDIKAINHSLRWMIAELKRIIVARNLPSSSVLASMQFIQRLSTSPHADSILNQFPQQIIEPLYRVASGSDGRGGGGRDADNDGTTNSLMNSAEETLEQVKSVLGSKTFADHYQEISSRLAKSRTGKKRKMAVMAVTNPQEYANKRIKRNEASERRRQRKRKIKENHTNDDNNNNKNNDNDRYKPKKKKARNSK